MKRPHYSAQDQTEEALGLLKEIGATIPTPMAVIKYDNTIAYANPGFLGFTEGKGPGFLLRYVEQVSDFLPDPAVLEHVWHHGDPCTVEVTLPRAAGTTTMLCDCVPFMDLRERVTLVTLIYRPVDSSEGGTSGNHGGSDSSESLSEALRKSCRDFGETLDRFSRGFLEKTDPAGPDDPLAGLKHKYNDGIDHVRKMLSVKGLFE
jgi:hypothetical protein